jgi:glycerophosphoryl diester phosphodiesterase
VTLVIAHRTGPLDGPENSPAAVARSIELGADAIEFDVRRGRGASLLCVHDHTLTRTVGVPIPVRWTSPRLAQRLARRGRTWALDDFLAAIPHDASLAVDVKQTAAMAGTIDVLKRAGALARSRLWVRSITGVRIAAERAPQCERALLRNTEDVAASERYLRDAAACGATAVSLHVDAVVRGGAELIDLAHELALTAHCWVTRADAHPAALDAGVDSVVTDWPALARELIAKRTIS